MKYLYLIIFLLAYNWLQAQSCDYINERYGVRSVKKIFVGTEPDFQNKPDSLFLDIYYPVGVTEAKRPLVMWVFGGGFITGKREDFAAICEGCAKRGFVAATIDYRIGFNGTSILPYDSAEVIRAGFRGSQDAKCALRYLKSRHLEDSIDLDRVWVGGASAGSIVALATAFYDKDSEKPTQAGAISPANGNVRGDLGSIEGSRFINGHDTKVQGVFNIFGAVLDLSIIDNKDQIAVFSYHQTEDPVVPCGHRKAYWAYPVVTDYYPYANGTCEIEPRLTQLGLPAGLHKAWIYPGNQHAVHNEAEVINFLLTNADPVLCGTVGVRDIQNNELNSALIRPNPATGSEIVVDGVESGAIFHITGLNGQLFVEGSMPLNGRLDISALENGMYFITLQHGANSKTLKFVKAAF